MADSRIIRNVTIAVWVVAAAVIVGLVFMKGAGAAPTLAPTTAALPIMYEFSSQT
jgi:hypothetical protein